MVYYRGGRSSASCARATKVTKAIRACAFTGEPNRFPHRLGRLSGSLEGASDLHGWRKCKGLLGTILALSLRWTCGLQRFAFPAPACKSGVCLPWQTRSAGPSMRYAVPTSLWHRPKPSVAWAFGGVKVHRTFTCYRLAHWTFAYIRFTPLAPLLAGCCARMHECRGCMDARERPSSRSAFGSA